MSPNTLGTILLVDSESNITELLQVNLAAEGYDVRILDRAKAARQENMDNVLLVITDCMEQPYTGLDLVHDIKENPETMHISVILYSKYRSQNMVIEALEAGADDYVLKPFSLSELMARVKAIMRRSAIRAARMGTVHRRTAPAPAAGPVLTFKTLVLDPAARTARDADTPLTLSKTEFAILEQLVLNVNTFLTRQEIHSAVWHDEDPGANQRVVDTNISRLRKKLGQYSNALVNRTGFGYMLTDR